MLTEKLTKNIVKKILEVSNPEKIILFGSQVREDNRANSDIDLTIKGISRETSCNIKEILNEEMDALLDFDVLSLDDIDNPKLKKRVFEEGETIYERDDQ